MPRPLKVYRTAIGFHDAYIATPTKKAAIEAWGADKDIFQRGEAEEVTDPALTAEPLASPGEIIKRMRGTSAEHIAALESSPSAKTKRPSGKAEAERKTRRQPPKPKPRPSRTKVEKAEAAIAAAKKEHEAQLARIAEEEAALRAERREVQAQLRKETATLERALAEAEADYQAAIQKWRG